MLLCPKEIDRQFGYLDVEEAGTDSQEDRRSGKSVGGKKYRNPVPTADPRQVKSDSGRAGQQIETEKPKGPGKTTFAERVKLFQNLGKKPPEEAAATAPEPPPPQPLLQAVGQKSKRIAFLDLVGRHERQKGFEVPAKTNNGPTLPTIAEAATPSSDKALLREEDDELPAILKSAELRRRSSDDRHSKMHGDVKLSPKPPNSAENDDEFYQEIDSEEYENCPYCNNEYSISTGGVCSTCDSCTCDDCSQNGEEEREGERQKGSGAEGKEQQSFGHHSIAANSWNYLNSDKRSDEDNDDDEDEEGEGEGDDQSSLSAAESVINLLNEVHQAAAAATAATPSPTEKPLSPEHNLRRQLKEAFGRSASSPVSNGNPNNNVVVTHFAHHVSNDLNGDKNQPLPILPTDFLSDYASRKELGGGGDGAVLLREGETVRLTEEMFRGGSDIIPKNLIVRKQHLSVSVASENGSDSGRAGQIIPDSGRMGPEPGKGGKKKMTGLSGSEMGDSGISSPPPFGAPPSLAISPRPPIAEEDSGVEGEQQVPERKIPVGGFSMLQPVAAATVVPKVPKRDTMIRELKSKLRERFKQNGDSDGTVEDTSSGDDCSAKNVVGCGKGLVESRRESIGPQLGRIFAGGSSIASGSRLSLARSQGQSSGPLDLEATAAPPALPPKVSISRNESARSNATTTFKSIYESRMMQSCNNRPVENVYFESNASTVYDPSLPEELKKSVPAGLMFRDVSRPLTPPPNLPAKSRDADIKAKMPSQQQCDQGGAISLGLGGVDLRNVVTLPC